MTLQYHNIHIKSLILILVLLLYSNSSYAQIIKGNVTDSITNEPLGYVSVYYDGTTIGTTTDFDGNYNIQYNSKYKELTFSFVGYKTKKVKINAQSKSINVELVTDDVILSEVIIKPKKERYKKKNNPAVELMDKVIKNKKEFKLEENDFYQYNKYQKMKISLNDLTEEKLSKGVYKGLGFKSDQLEMSKTTGGFILPISIQETASKVAYRKEPKSTKTFVEGMNSTGIQDFISTGEIMNQMVEEIFSDINIYDDNIKLLRRRFVSPISNTATSFYKFYIMDTVRVDLDECIHLSFVPHNSQDFGFTGHLYVLNDSSYAVKKCTMNLPQNTAVNFVTNLDIIQEFTELPNGNMVLKKDIMEADIHLLQAIQGMQIQRTTRYSNYSFEEIPARNFRHKGDVVKENNMFNRPPEYWEEARQVGLTNIEDSMDSFMERLSKAPAFKYMLFATKLLFENYIETSKRGKPSKFDIGPINTAISGNYIDGTRFRFGGKTTAALHPKVFVQGYGAYGIKDKRWKYSGGITYSFHKCESFPWEYPMNNITFTYTSDIMSQMDKFLTTDKDNIFVGWKAFPVDQMSYYRSAKIDYNYEVLGGFSVKAHAKRLNDKPAGKLEYLLNDADQTKVRDITTTELGFTLRYAPGENYINTKQRRKPVSWDAPIFTLAHSAAIKGLLGGQYNSNITEASIWKRIWLASWGKLDVSFKAGAQWNTVPFPLLIAPAANLSYIAQNNETFNLLHNMEFMNDRYASLALTYDMNGKLLNRIPLIKKLKWRELFKIKALYGHLTDKNNPLKSSNPELFLFPTRDGEISTHIMEKNKPYIEASFGIYNIFKIFHIEYIRRLTYTDIPGTKKNGIRFTFELVF